MRCTRLVALWSLAVRVELWRDWVVLMCAPQVPCVEDELDLGVDEGPGEVLEVPPDGGVGGEGDGFAR